MSIYNKVDKIIILGGTFDPIHNGHMQIAEKLYAVFNTPITFMPTGTPPHKAPPKASKQQRLDMLELALANSPKFNIERMEIDSDEFSYSYKTLARLRKKVGNDIPIYFLIGADSLLTLDTWHYWENILEMTNFIIVRREGYSCIELESPLLSDIYNKNKILEPDQINMPYGKFYELNFTPQNVSSTIIRKLVYDNNKDISSLVPPAIADYILQRGLYSQIFS